MGGRCYSSDGCFPQVYLESCHASEGGLAQGSVTFVDPKEALFYSLLTDT